MSVRAGILIASLLLVQHVPMGSVFPSASTPSPTFVQATSSGVGSGLTLTTSLTGVTAGDFLAIFPVWYAADSPTALTDNGSAILTPALTTHPVVWDAGARSVDLYILPNAAAGTHAIAITFSGSARLIAIGISEFSGASIASGTASIDGSTSNVITTSVNPQSCTAITTTQANDTVFAGEGTTVGSTGAGAGYTLRQTFVTFWTIQDGPTTTISTYTPTFTISAGHPAVCVAVAIKHA